MHAACLADGAAEKTALHRVYDMARGAAATVRSRLVSRPSTIRDREQGNDPGQVDSVLREPSGTYEVRWTETIRNLNGDVLSTPIGARLLAVLLVPPDPDHLLTQSHRPLRDSDRLERGARLMKRGTMIFGAAAIVVTGILSGCAAQPPAHHRS